MCDLISKELYFIVLLYFIDKNFVFFYYVLFSSDYALFLIVQPSTEPPVLVRFAPAPIRYKLLNVSLRARDIPRNFNGMWVSFISYSILDSKSLSLRRVDRIYDAFVLKQLVSEKLGL